MSLSSSLGSSGSASSSRPKVNLRSTAVKRIMQEAAELEGANTMDEDFVAGPLESDIFEWHCTMRGVAGSEYEGGIYHFRILLPASYPMSPPDILLLTPNGRFELGKKICIDGLTSFHVGSWQPAWGVRTAILGLRSFWMQQQGEVMAAVGAMSCSTEERKRLATLSRVWTCPTCETCNKDILPDRPIESSMGSGGDVKTEEEGVGSSIAEGSGGGVSGSANQSSPRDPRPAERLTISSSQTLASPLVSDASQAATETTSRHETGTSARPPLFSNNLDNTPGRDGKAVTGEAEAPGGYASGPPVPVPSVVTTHESSPERREISAAAEVEGSSGSGRGQTSLPPALQATERVAVPMDARERAAPAVEEDAARTIRPNTQIQPRPTPSASTAHDRRAPDRFTPFWLDAAIVGLGMVIVALLARRLYLGDPDLDGALRASLTDL